MAEPAVPAAGSGRPSFPSFLRNLSPQQRRMAIALGIGGVLALVVVLSRRQGAPTAEEEATAAADPYLAEAAVPMGSPPFEPYSSFADNGEAAGVLGSAITEGLRDVSDVIGLEQESFDRLVEGLDERFDAAVLPPGTLESLLESGVSNAAAIAALQGQVGKGDAGRGRGGRGGKGRGSGKGDRDRGGKGGKGGKNGKGGGGKGGGKGKRSVRTPVRRVVSGVAAPGPAPRASSPAPVTSLGQARLRPAPAVRAQPARAKPRPKPQPKKKGGKR